MHGAYIGLASQIWYATLCTDTSRNMRCAPLVIPLISRNTPDNESVWQLSNILDKLFSRHKMVDPFDTSYKKPYVSAACVTCVCLNAKH